MNKLTHRLQARTDSCNFTYCMAPLLRLRSLGGTVAELLDTCVALWEDAVRRKSRAYFVCRIKSARPELPLPFVGSPTNGMARF